MKFFVLLSLTVLCAAGSATADCAGDMAICAGKVQGMGDLMGDTQTPEGIKKLCTFLTGMMSCFENLATTCPNMASTVDTMKQGMAAAGQLCGKDGTGEGKCSAPSVMACMSDNGIDLMASEGEPDLAVVCPKVSNVQTCMTGIKTECAGNDMIQQQMDQILPGITAMVNQCESAGYAVKEKESGSSVSDDQDNHGMVAKASVVLLSILSLAAMAWV